MSGSVSQRRSRGLRRGVTLTAVFVGVLATAAATDSLPRVPERPPRVTAQAPVATVDGEAVARVAAQAVADGKSGTEAAEDFVGRSGDRWGAVYDKTEFAEFEQALDGEYTGVGLSARRTADGRIQVTRVRPRGPAAGARVRAGDIVREIDGNGVARAPVTEVMALLRGDPTRAPAGTPVLLGLERTGRRWTVNLRRARLTTEGVTVGTVPGGATRIKVPSFTRGTGERVRKAVFAAPPGAGVLLDLRGNAGGLVTEAVTAASAFLDGGLVATYDMKGEQRALYADAGGDTGRPLVVLVDGGTMSAAELVAGALQDRGRSITVGSRTFGKGSVQMPSRLPGGSVAELTVGHYRTPSGHAVDGRGITPDLFSGDLAQQRAETVLSGLGGGR